QCHYAGTGCTLSPESACLFSPDSPRLSRGGEDSRRPGRSRFHIDLGRNAAGHKPSEFAARCSNRLLSGNATAKRNRGPKPVGAGKSYASVSRRPGKAVWNRSHPESHQGTRDHRNSLITKVASPFGGTSIGATRVSRSDRAEAHAIVSSM